jgi:hypothetical protein
LTFDEIPFIEISPIERVTQKISLAAGDSPEVSQTVTEIETDISKFNKKHLCDVIIEKGEFASQRLLRLAVSYRFAHFNYSGNPNVRNSGTSETADIEELKLIREIVCCIVSEYNQLRKDLNMDYDERELVNGKPNTYIK